MNNPKFNSKLLRMQKKGFNIPHIGRGVYNL
jgi:hypothetical protein